eukprot:SAG11_NODE_3058_length_2719_cov_3.741985_1_plen_104_part_00
MFADSPTALGPARQPPDLRLADRRWRSKARADAGAARHGAERLRPGRGGDRRPGLLRDDRDRDARVPGGGRPRDGGGWGLMPFPERSSALLWPIPNAARARLS